MGAIKWIGGVMGWAFGGVMGGIIGFAVGSMFDNAFTGEQVNSSPGGSGQARMGRPQTQPGDFGVSLLILSAAVMNSDRQVLRSELDYVKEFFKRQFGQAKAESYISMLRELLKQNIDLKEVCLQIKMYMDHASRLQLIHYLFGLSKADGHVHPDEVQTIRNISNWLGISIVDYESIQAMFIKSAESAYKILEITPQATDEEVRKAYKRMAVKHHPDKVSHLGEDVQKAANDKFKEVNSAYDRIKKERGLN
ncbi:MAG TPA: TerB family tellurite resistance protein [Bacteroidales bacterium]|nr:TerB family tellurite resistance protein [Bacteroidales bacterium]